MRQTSPCRPSVEQVVPPSSTTRTVPGVDLEVCRASRTPRPAVPSADVRVVPSSPGETPVLAAVSSTARYSARRSDQGSRTSSPACSPARSTSPGSADRRGHDASMITSLGTCRFRYAAIRIDHREARPDRVGKRDRGLDRARSPGESCSIAAAQSSCRRSRSRDALERCAVLIEDVAK